MFNKILIANRGEIACRIARTARRLGVATVAVYSEVDRFSLHVAACDEAFCIGAAEASESYLNHQKILQIAKKSGAEAVHPGYGFLSENAEFARACEEASIAFIGPPIAAIEAMGSKSEAKKLMQKAGVPLVPGYHDEDQDESFLAEQSASIGYPQLIKASAGGGGKGMRIVNQASEFEAALISAKRESLASFGDDKVLIERYLVAPRHVEVQVFADKQGNAVHLFERDCSIQRRHQKILEEAPAPGMTESLRAQMTEAAILSAKAIDYVGAGTVEFLLDHDGSFYFMEMNTRLQVEHPVTEMITGLDLVQWQLEVAAGESLPLKQQEICLNGHAIEARIYAESPDNNFLPSTGKLLYHRTPETGPDVRVDTGVGQGDEISVYYDPMIAKLIVHAADRTQALKKMRMALNEYQIMGLQTNIGFLADLVGQQALIDADFDTGFIENHKSSLFKPYDNYPNKVVLLVALYRLAKLSDKTNNAQTKQFNTEVSSPWQINDHWRMNQTYNRQMTFYDGRAEYSDREYSVEIRAGELSADKNTPVENHWICGLNQQQYQASSRLVDATRLIAEIDGEKFDVPVITHKGGLIIWFENRQWFFALEDSVHHGFVTESNSNELVAPMPGNVIVVSVSEGDKVAAGDVLIVVEAMKMEHSIVAPIDAVVAEIFFVPGDQVEDGDRLIRLE